MDFIQLSETIEVAHVGPPLDSGPLPAVFYFALSATESLTLDPYNQPATFLYNYPVRVFSIDLPFHGPDLNALDALSHWATAYNEGRDLLTPFIEDILLAIEGLIARRYVLKDHLGVMGLSRGAFIASHVAARLPFIKTILGFAPLTKLTFTTEFQKGVSNEKAESLNLENLLESLYDKTCRFYIGNRDTRVGTDRCFQFISALAETAYQKGIRSSPIELIISPSIGNKGHGTSKAIFEAGADWMGKKLGIIK